MNIRHPKVIVQDKRMKPFHLPYIWLFIHIFTLWPVKNKCLAYKKLNAVEIDELYEIDHESNKNISQGAYSLVKYGTRKSDGKEVALKFELKPLDIGVSLTCLLKEINFYERLQNRYGNLVKCHLVNMVDHGTYKMTNAGGEVCEYNVLILERFGVRVYEESRKYGKVVPWPKICKIMKDLFTALECLCGEDISHGDIHLGNMAHGTEPEPANGEKRKDVMYKTDVFVYDLGRSVELTNNVPFHLLLCEDIRKANSMLLFLLTSSLTMKKGTVDKNESILDSYRKAVDLHPKLNGVPDEKERKHALVEFYRLYRELNDNHSGDDLQGFRRISKETIKNIRRIFANDENENEHEDTTKREKNEKKKGKTKSENNETKGKKKGRKTQTKATTKTKAPKK